MRSGLALLVFACLSLAGCAPPFTPQLPPGVPDVTRWESVSGLAELQNARLRYVFYVNPRRLARYEVARYRPVDERGRAALEVPEQLQWQAGNTDVRRFECRPTATGCTWHELPKGSQEYLREIPILLQIYGAHRRQGSAGR
jgi:hypothetical protein